MKRRASLVVGVTVFTLHLAVTYVAWSLHPGNTVPGAFKPSWILSNAFGILSFPLVSPISSALPGAFWVAFCLNSALWAIIVTLGLSRGLRARGHAAVS
jgi:hypothetical protein